MGQTWEAVRRGEHGFEQRVAIKLASKSVLQQKEGLELFRREASLAASLRHPNIASVLDVDERLGYLIYELIDGTDLRSVLREAPPGRLSMPLLVYVMAQISRGLAHAHKRVLHGKLSPVVHRDMSPGNVVVDYDGNLKIVDFGIAKATTVSDRSETIKGKLAYMAPEQVTGGQVDGRVDQYALGVMAYEAVTGVRPNDGAHDGETLSKILSGDHVPVTKRAPDIPAGLGEIIERMIAVNPEDRFASMDAVLDALGAFNPPLTIHRELAQLVHRASPPHTIMVRDGAFVSVPVLAPQNAAHAARTLAGPSLRAPTGLSQPVPETEAFTRPPQPLSTPPTDIGRAHTIVASEPPGARRAAGALALEPPSPPPTATPAPTAVTGLRSPLPVWLSAAAALALGLGGWAWFSQTTGPAALSAGTDGAELSARLAGANTTSSSSTSLPSSAVGPASSASPSSMNTAPPTIDSLMPAPATAHALSDSALRAATPADTRTDSTSPNSASQDTAAEPATTEHDKPVRKRPARRGDPAENKAERTATVRVRVFPWGRVWIDGKVRGSVPPILETTLSAGTHEIAVGHEKPLETKKITLVAGQNQLVSFDLEGK